MVSHAAPASLLPYLHSGNIRLRLEIMLRPDAPAASAQGAAPFLLIDDTHPFARLFEGRFVTDAGAELRRVFILAQRDTYPLSPNPLRPLTNQDMEALWQRSFQYHQERAGENALILLASQTPFPGELTPLRSLFFCLRKNVFFHPPCPVCGTLLEPCYDDELLRTSRLRPYSKSLTRYLYCPACLASSGTSDFFAPTVDGDDPPLLKPGEALMRGFAHLARDSGGEVLPCVNCPETEACYSAEGHAATRIVPFAFHPFFMLIFEAATLGAPDFLALLAGAPREELERRLYESGATGRLRCLRALAGPTDGDESFLFPKDHPNRFLEVLYLKLCFLRTCARTVLSRHDFFGPPDSSFSLERLWVNMPQGGGSLPSFRDFSLRYLGTLGGGGGHQFPDTLFTSYALHLLGRVWFYTLLANQRQDMAVVCAALKKAHEQIASADTLTFDRLLQPLSDRTLSGENLFWDPTEAPFQEEWGPLWRRALRLGWNLLCNDVAGDAEAAADAFEHQVDALREEVNQLMFRSPDHAAPLQERTAGPAEDAAIREILAGIRAAWSASKPSVRDSAPGKAPQAGDADTLAQTVMVSATAGMDPDATLAASSDQRATLPFFMKPAAADLAQTVVLGASGQAPSPVAAPPPPTPQEEDILAATVAIPPRGQVLSTEQGLPAAHKAKPPPLEEDDLMTETVILRAGHFDNGK